jgi:hypothetical protein
MSGLGWCLHPQRRVTHDLKIMVRRGELGCRDGWSRDLWAPSGEVNVAAPAEAPLTGPVRPVTPEEMTYLVASKHVTLQQTTIGPISSPVDVVVGETPAMPVDEDRATLLSHDPRAAIEAARKRHLANLQGPNQPTPTPQAPATSTSSFYADSQSYHSTFTPPLSSPPEPKPVEQQVAPRPIVPRYVREVAPVRPDEVPRDTTGTASTREDESHFSSVPDLVDGFDLPREGSDGRPVLVAGTYDDDVEIAPTRVRATRRWPIAEEEIDTPAIELASAYAADAQQYEEAPIRGGAFEDDWNYESDETNYEDSSYSEEEIISEPPPPRRRWQPSFRLQRPARVQATEYVADEWEEDYYEDQYVAPNEAEIEPLLPDPAFEWREPDDPLETSVEVAPMIPRMCRTCRDFRPADNGGRGWCANKWAFSHRRMVDEDELPCETSLGCWWLPHDDVWLAEADAAAHTEPTPLVDHWLERRTGVTAATGTRRR